MSRVSSCSASDSGDQRRSSTSRFGVKAPVVAVPTSRGYGASFGGLAALLTMLNSCAAGVGVMNIDNGFGAGCLAHRINVLAGC